MYDTRTVFTLFKRGLDCTGKRWNFQLEEIACRWSYLWRNIFTSSTGPFHQLSATATPQTPNRTAMQIGVRDSPGSDPTKPSDQVRDRQLILPECNLIATSYYSPSPLPSHLYMFNCDRSTPPSHPPPRTPFSISTSPRCPHWREYATPKSHGLPTS